MKKETTKPVKKKLEFKKSTIAKFVINQLGMILGGSNHNTGDSAERTGCTSFQSPQ